MAVTFASPKAFTVHFKDLVRWDIKTARAVRFYQEHPTFRPLSEFAEEATEIVRPWEKGDQEWPVYGVNNETGVFRSHLQRGDSFNAPYKRIRRDWFFHNPTRANVGSLGRVPGVPADAITSPEYQVWRIRRSITPDFMELLLRLPFFLEQVEFHRVGAVKERLFVQNLLEIRIPALSEAQQTKVVEHWRKAQEQIAAAEGRMAELEAEIADSLLNVLGLKPPPERTELPKAFALWWKDVPRWSVEYLARLVVGLERPERARFPMVPLANLAEGRSGGTPSTKQPLYWGGQLPWVSPKDMKTLEVTDSLDHLTEYAVKEGVAALVPENSILVVVRSGILQRAVPVAISRIPVTINQDLRAFTIKDPRLLPDFLLHYLNVRQDKLLRLVKYSTTVQSVNKEELEAFLVPLPPLDVQLEIVDMLDKRRAEISCERECATRRAADAAREAEEMILGFRPVG